MVACAVRIRSASLARHHATPHTLSRRLRKADRSDEARSGPHGVKRTAALRSLSYVGPRRWHLETPHTHLGKSRNTSQRMAFRSFGFTTWSLARMAVHLHPSTLFSALAAPPTPDSPSAPSVAVPSVCRTRAHGRGSECCADRGGEAITLVFPKASPLQQGPAHPMRSVAPAHPAPHAACSPPYT
jgi:hypothetical protein